MLILKKLIKFILWWTITGSLGAILIAASAYLYLSPKLPSADAYRNIRLENPLRIYTADNKLIAEFGNQKRDPIKYEAIPSLLVNALIASEDSRFYSHHGVDLKALARSVFGILTGNQNGGGSTITMQVAKNISFEGEDPYSRKFKEILLALQIERTLSKEEIIELYLNRIFFGISAYGISAAATQYYDKTLDELELAEIAMTIAVLPAPNSYNPLSSPDLAVTFRSRVLRRMQQLDMISMEQFKQADNAPLTAQRHNRKTEVDAPYVAEMVRLDMIERYGEKALTDGFEVYTTLDSRMQEVANISLENGLEIYDRRHGYRGRENQMLPASDGSTTHWLNTLKRTSTVASQQPAFVQSVDEKSISALLKSGESITIEWNEIVWAKKFINTNTWQRSPRTAGEVAAVGDLIRVKKSANDRWMISQVPDVNGGMVSIDPSNGAIRALVGGYDFNRNKYNRITQAERQPGSNFKPFLYSAALENGYTAASLINDAPLPRIDYRPENYNGKFLGPLRLKYALTNSKNLVSVRLFDALSSDIVLPYISKFGFRGEEFPSNDLSVALGSHAVKPLEIATAYTVFANGGFKVEPYFIDRITNFNDGDVFHSQPYFVCNNCNSILNMPDTPEINEQTLSTDINSSETQTAPTSAKDILARLEAAALNDDKEDSTEPSNSDLKAEISNIELSENQLSNDILEANNYLPAPRVIDEDVAYIMNTILRSVITSGSGRPANRAIDRLDIAGKTGTTNDAKALWFSGFNGDLVTTVYVGFDQLQTLGRSEQAATVALPIWIEFMKEVLGDNPENSMIQPDGLVSVRINKETGLRAVANERNTIFEVFREENIPDYPTEEAESNTFNTSDPSLSVDDIF